MKKIAIQVVTGTMLLLLFTTLSFAQEKKEKVEKEEIIIRKKGEKNEKTVIVIEGDKITINGKPVDKTNKEVIIERFSDKEGDVIMRMPKSPLIQIHPKIQNRFEWNDDGQTFEREEFKHTFNSRAFLGVVTDANEKRAAIKEVQKETAAEKAGLQKGDIITKVNDKNIKNPQDLVEAITTKKPNEEVDITFLQNGKEKKVKVKLGESKMPGGMNHFELKVPEMPGFENKEFQFQLKHPGNEEMFMEQQIMMQKGPKLGISIQDTEEGNGVKVLEVNNDSPASKGGLQKEDLITEINGKKINTVSEARDAMQEKNEKNSWSLKVLRQGTIVSINVKVPKVLKKANL